jgi:hypothetical protein
MNLDLPKMIFFLCPIGYSTISGIYWTFLEVALRCPKHIQAKG